MSVTINFYGIRENTTVAAARDIFKANNAQLYKTIEKDAPVFYLNVVMAVFLGFGMRSDSTTMSMVRACGYTKEKATWVRNITNGIFGTSKLYPLSQKTVQSGWDWRLPAFNQLCLDIDQNASTLTFGDVYDKVASSKVWDGTVKATNGLEYDMSVVRNTILSWVQDKNNAPSGNRRGSSASGSTTSPSAPVPGAAPAGDQDLDFSVTAESIIEEILSSSPGKDPIRQVVFTGAPGTGKTYAVQKFLEGKAHSFVQFHASYDYTDFVEGLRPIPASGEAGGNRFVRMDGIFKEFCREIVEKNLAEAAASGNAAAQHPEVYENQLRQPGWRGNNEYYFFIDEINRADLGRVFGELMFALEKGYRGVAFNTQYKNLPTYRKVGAEYLPIAKEDDVFANGFFLPQNLTIIGTMNDIDRNVETFDFALRRRFRWVDIKSNAVMAGTLLSMLKRSAPDDELKTAIYAAMDMNRELSQEPFKLSSAYYLGPVYFRKILDAPNEMWSQEIEPILTEYTRGYDPKDVSGLLERCYGDLFGDAQPQDDD